MDSEIKISQKLDKEDTLKNFKKEFLNNSNEIYLDGNSLGKLPLTSLIKVKNVLEKEWGENLIESWNDHWLKLVERVSSKLERLFNSSNDEIVVGESTSVFLYQILHSLINSKIYEPNLISDNLNFPSDLYVIDSICSLTQNSKKTIIDYESDIEAKIELLKEKIKEKPGIITLSLVSYKSSWLYPMKELNEWAKKNNSIIIWDLSHAAGVVHIDFKKTKTLVAVGCTYKYLNGGPGSPAFLYVKKELLKSIRNPIRGWFGHSNPFSFSKKFIQNPGIMKFTNGTPNILSIAPIESGIDIILKAGTKSIQEKSRKQSDYLKNLILKYLIPLGYKIESPLLSNNRGSHISISHKESWRICRSLKEGPLKVIPDYRPPKYIRLGIAPLYNSYEDLTRAIYKIREITQNKEFLKHTKAKPKVT